MFVLRIVVMALILCYISMGILFFIIFGSPSLGRVDFDRHENLQKNVFGGY